MDIYQEHIMDHYHHPRNKGTLDNPSVVFSDTNPLCGDLITINLNEEKGKITRARFSSSGCAVSQAAASMLFEQLEGKSIKEVLEIHKDNVLAEFGTELSVSRVKCALLPLFAVKKALVKHARD